MESVLRIVKCFGDGRGEPFPLAVVEFELNEGYVELDIGCFKDDELDGWCFDASQLRDLAKFCNQVAGMLEEAQS